MLWLLGDWRSWSVRRIDVLLLSSLLLLLLKKMLLLLLLLLLLVLGEGMNVLSSLIVGARLLASVTWRDLMLRLMLQRLQRLSGLLLHA